MNMKPRLLIVVFLALAALPVWSSRLVAAENHDITVNGLSGTVTPSQPLTIARPGDTVTVTVCPADLINYSYSIDKAKEEALTEAFPIVGVPPPSPSKATGQVGQTALALPTPTDRAKPDEKALFDEFLAIRGELAHERDKVNEALDSIGKAMASLPSMATCSTWPQPILTAIGAQPESFFTQAQARGKSIDDLERRTQNLLGAIDESNLRAESQGGKTSAFLDDLARKATTFQATFTDLRKSLAGGAQIVDRWSRIIALHPEPKLVQKFPMPQTSTRISISVSRMPITNSARNEAPEGTEPAKVAASVIATTTVENRAYHRFNVSLGMVGSYKGDNRDFDIAPSVDASSNITFHVRQTKHDQIATEAAAFLGIYLNKDGIDPFDLTRGPAWMVMLGSEISSSPKDFFVGLGLDTKQGVVFGFGITEYQSVELTHGLKPDQEVPGKDGKPLISVSKTNKDTIGAYLFLGFRPSIFRAFLDSRKP